MMRPVMMMSRGLLLFLCLLSVLNVNPVGQDTTTTPPMTTSTSVRFWCGATPCPAGQDCISFGGSLLCADPCEQYSVLDDAWRSTNYNVSNNCDAWISWQGWYRMFLEGNSTQMSETCVAVNRCGTQVPLWLSSSHPLLGDGLVERGVCGHWSYDPEYWWGVDDCCYYKSNRIHVKACPGNYYVYKFVRSNVCYSAYCAAAPTTTKAAPTITTAAPTTTTAAPTTTTAAPTITTAAPTTTTAAPTTTTAAPTTTTAAPTTTTAAPTTTTAAPTTTTAAPTTTTAAPTTTTAAPTTTTAAPTTTTAAPTTTTAAPTTTTAAPTTTTAAPTTSTEAKTTIYAKVWCAGTPCPAGQDCINVNGSLRCADPCEQYSVLDDAWRSTGYGRSNKCDNGFSGQGWYRMFLDGNSTQMSETCVDMNRCGTQVPLWLSSPHPLLGDGVVERGVCGHWSYSQYSWYSNTGGWVDDCCYHRHNIHVKACPGSYYVYKFAPSSYCNSAYCAAIPTTTPAVPTTTPAVPMTPSSSVRFWCGATPCPVGQDCISVNGSLRCADPCEQYSVLDDAWRSTGYGHSDNCDAWISWQGWYRMFLDGNSTQMSETCVEVNRCGTRVTLWLSSPHPLLGDGLVERGVCEHQQFFNPWGRQAEWVDDCCYYRHNIHVKACPGSYYVYKFVGSSVCYSAYCAALPTTTPAVPTTTPTVPETPSSSVRFWCGATPCLAGQDCLIVNGALRCVDPCEQYSVLDDAWRSTGYALTYNCDNGFNGQRWYRMFLQGTSVQMPETCVDMNRCGTQTPMWLSSPHPLLGDGVVKREVCGQGNGNKWWWWYFTHGRGNECCFYRTDIHVKSCPGHYYVYKFTPLHSCNTAYCADPNSKVCATCHEYEDCVSHDGVTWNCGTTITPELVCGRSYLDVGLLNSQLAAKHLDSSSVHLANARCSSSQESNGTVWFQMERWEGSCGTTLTTNGSHAIYSNSLYVYPTRNVTMVRPVRIPFSCSYPLETEASLDVAIRPYLDLEGAVKDEGAKARASMSLFRDASYTAPYSAGPVTLPLGSILHVGVSVEETEIDRFVVVLEDCYATHSPFPDDLLKYLLIQHKCPVNRRQVAVEESGLSLQARFSALLFLFQGDYRDVYLHCSLNLCDQRNSSCSPMCSGRSVRSVDELVPLKPITIGPITWGQSLE